jgi:hypothetical protein
MGRLYKSLEELRRHADRYKRQDLHLLLVSDTVDSELYGCSFAMTFLEFLGKDAELVDLGGQPLLGLDYFLPADSTPFFRNASNHPHLPVQAFEQNVPAIFSVNSHSYMRRILPEIRNQYDVVCQDW